MPHRLYEPVARRARHRCESCRAPEVVFNLEFEVEHIIPRALALALEFLLGADILRTAVEPSWDEIGRLAAIAAIRTALNYFLQREIAQDARLVDQVDRAAMREVLASHPDAGTVSSRCGPLSGPARCCG